MWRHASLFVIVAMLAGCSGLRYGPAPTGVMWAYQAESRTIPRLRMVAYTPDRPTCDVIRAKDMNPSPDTAWLQVRITSECYRAIVNDGDDYWAIGLSNGTAIEWCWKARERYGGECRPVDVKVLP